MLVVPGIGAHAEDPRIARLTACGKGSGVELVSREAIAAWTQRGDGEALRSLGGHGGRDRRASEAVGIPTSVSGQPPGESRPADPDHLKMQ